MGLLELKWSSPGDDTAPKLPTTLWFEALPNHEEAPDELDELQEDEIIPTENKKFRDYNFRS